MPTLVGPATIIGLVLCSTCDFAPVVQHNVLWPALIDAWDLEEQQARYINRPQEFRCVQRESSFRSMAFAQTRRDDTRLPNLAHLGAALLYRPFARVFEINTAGNLTGYLRRLPRHVLVQYPGTDMRSLPFGHSAFDLVVRSDNLELVEDFDRGLRETVRVLWPRGALCFNAPLLVERLTCSCAGLRPSHHGSDSNPEDCLVHTEFGEDLWSLVLAEGFVSCTFRAFEHPAGLSVTARTSHPKKPWGPRRHRRASTSAELHETAQ